ncbi:formate dehydrogenase accessory sulfurtransferase FdhD [Castellaniella hirudinis]|uniref:formate dehydrogenase accessory sulfurtransferase FdhD n=1 Tax=Castellaniella hirudinis TaxID=1144617 RepID=UPI0039C1EF91
MHPADYNPLAAQPGGAAAHQLCAVTQLHGPQASQSQDAVACEQAVALEYNGIAHATLLASPQHLAELALGFSFTEGIIRSPADVLDLDIESTPLGLVIHLTILNARLHALKLRHRNLAGSTGCGLCGVEGLAQIPRSLAALPPPARPWRQAAIDRAVRQLRAHQPLHNLTGATHAAAWADADGRLAWVFEDVGRHNALDKLIGHLLRQPGNHQDGFVVVSSRASFEMVQKAHAAGIRALVAVSAPTALAVQLALTAPMLLAGFTRDERFTVYSRPDYLQHRSQP